MAEDWTRCPTAWIVCAVTDWVNEELGRRGGALPDGWPARKRQFKFQEETMDYNPQTAMTRYQPRYSRQGPIPVPPRPVMDRPAAMAPAASEAAQGDALKAIHRHLKGHYRLAVALALVGATIGSFVGFKLSPPEYRSEGSVRIAYSLPLSTQNTGQQMPMTLFDAYIRSQMLEITSRTVVEQAMDDPAWQAIGRNERKTKTK